MIVYECKRCGYRTRIAPVPFCCPRCGSVLKQVGREIKHTNLNPGDRPSANSACKPYRGATDQ